MSQQKASGEEDISHLSEIIGSLDISAETTEYATNIYKQILRDHSNITNGRGKELVAASSVVLGSYKSQEIVDTSDVLEVVSDYITEKSIHRTARHIRSKLNEGLLLDDPRKYVDEIAESLNASDEYTKTVEKLITALEDSGVTSGKKASAIAAGAYYLTTLHKQTKYTQQEIASAVGVSEVTIRKNYQRFREEIDVKSVLSEEH